VALFDFSQSYKAIDIDTSTVSSSTLKRAPKALIDSFIVDIPTRHAAWKKESGVVFYMDNLDFDRRDGRSETGYHKAARSPASWCPWREDRSARQGTGH